MSSETKHTLGPIINDGETPRGVMLLAGPEDRETIIYLLGPERQQYARLIAAAPELLEACKAMNEAFRVDQTRFTAAQADAVRKMDAAIARATVQED